MNRQINIKLIETPLPAGINAVTKATEHDGYIVFLNGDNGDDERAASFLHECLHIYHRDFDRPESATQIEKMRHNELQRLFTAAGREEKQP